MSFSPETGRRARKEGGALSRRSTTKTKEEKERNERKKGERKVKKTTTLNIAHTHTHTHTHTHRKNRVNGFRGFWESLAAAAGPLTRPATNERSRPGSAPPRSRRLPAPAACSTGATETWADGRFLGRPAPARPAAAVPTEDSAVVFNWGGGSSRGRAGRKTKQQQKRERKKGTATEIHRRIGGT